MIFFKKNLIFHFGGGCHASFPQKPVVKTVFFFIHYLGAHGKQMDLQQMDVLI